MSSAQEQAAFAHFMALDERAKSRFFRAIRHQLYGDDGNLPVDTLATDLREARYSSGFACPRCGSVAVKRNGVYRPASSQGKPRQRYLCKDCRQTFSDLAFSPISGTHYPEKWTEYFECMSKGMSLRKTAKALDIALSTAFLWRHKILAALQSVKLPELEGIIETDETYYLESQKGNKHIRGRRPRKRGGKASKRGVSRQQVCVLVAIDRDKRVVARRAGNGRITHQQVDSILGNHLGEVACLCSDSASCFKTYTRHKGIEHEILNMSKGVRVKRGIYHIQNVNSYHSRLKGWMLRFKGVATKYIDNYMFWFRFLDLNRRMALHQTKMAMMQESFKVPVELTTRLFRPCMGKSQ